jgi:hypothetical protein
MLLIAKRAVDQINIELVIRLAIVVVKMKVKVEITIVSHLMVNLTFFLP